MRNHPGPARREALGAAAARAASCAFFIAKRFSRTTATPATMSSFRSGQHLRRRRATLVGRVREPALGRHRREIWRGQKRPRRIRPTSRTFARQTGIGHRPHVGKWPAPVAEIVIDWHWFSSSTWAIAGSIARRLGRLPARTRRRAGHRVSGGHHLSGDIGISIPPVRCLVGPAALGITSNAKMSVGSHSVAQALGISTTPDMWPWHGAVPRIA